MGVYNIDLVHDADAGAEHHVYHPVTQEPLFSDNDPKKPFIVKAIGANATSLSPYLSKLRKASSEVATNRAMIEYISAAVVGWENLEENGEPVPFSKENCKRIFADPNNFWLANQLVIFINDLGNFSGADSKS